MQSSFAGILSARQLAFAEDPEGKRRADECMEAFLNSREILPQNEFPFAGSDEILKGVFELINRQVFNANLDGVKLEWCEKLKTRAVIAYEQRTHSNNQTYIRCSKAWFENRNRQQFVEAVLVSWIKYFCCKQKPHKKVSFLSLSLSLSVIHQYELIQLYIQKRGSDAGEETSPDLAAYLLYSGIQYFNICFGTNLVVNNNYKPHNDDKDVQEILNSIIIARTSSTGKIKNFTMPPQVKLLTKRITGNKNAVKCKNEKGCGAFCYGQGCPSAFALRQRYFGANIYFLFTVDPLKCFLCEKEIDKGTLNAHYNKDCKAFGRSKENVG